VRVSIEEGDIPLDGDTTEAFVTIATNGKITKEVNVEIDVVFKSDTLE
jgi:hypothetical protein